MARDVLTEKLESLKRCVKRIEDRRAGSAEEQEGDLDRQDILALIPCVPASRLGHRA